MTFEHKYSGKFILYVYGKSYFINTAKGEKESRLIQNGYVFLKRRQRKEKTR